MLSSRYDTIIGDMPNDWQVKHLRDLLTKSYSGEWGFDEGEQAVSILRSTNFTNSGTLDYSNVATRYFKKEKAATFGLYKGDLLIERSGGGPDQPVGRVGFIRNNIAGTSVSNFIHVLRPDLRKVDPEYLGWVLYELQRTGIIERIQQQSTQMRNLNWRDYQRIILPLPHLNEQYRISKSLMLTDDAIEAARKELNATFELKRSMLRSIFCYGVKKYTNILLTKWFACPSHWRIKKLRNIAEISSGFTMGRDLSRHDTKSVSYITVVNVQDGFFFIKNVGLIEIKDNEVEKYTLKYGDILMTEGGDRDKLGRGGMWKDEINPCSFQNHIFRVRLVGEYKPELFHYLIQTYQTKKYFYAHAKQTSNLCTINSRELKNWHIPIPPLDEQDKMIEILQAVDSQVAVANEKVTALEMLKKSLLQNLLTGKIRIPEGAIDV